MTRYRGTFWTHAGPVTVTLSATDEADAIRIVRRYAHRAFRGRLIVVDFGPDRGIAVTHVEQVAERSAA